MADYIVCAVLALLSLASIPLAVRLRREEGKP
jgi:hypothetical protein